MDNHETFHEVWGSAPNDVFAVGDGPIVHYDGQSWEEMEMELDVDVGDLYLQGIWGSSDTDVWAVGSGGDIFQFGSRPDSRTSSSDMVRW